MDQMELLISAEGQLKKFGVFLEDYSKQIKALLHKTKHITNVSSFHTPPIVIINYSANQEQLSLLRLLDSDRTLNKTLLTFAHLCREVDLLVYDARVMEAQFLYKDEDICAIAADSINITTTDSNEHVLLKMSTSIEFLCQVQFLLQRCTVIGNNLLHQCGAIFSSDEFALDFRLFHVFDYLADLLLHVLIFDELLSTSNFCRYWSLYKKTIETIANSSALPDICTSAEMDGLQNCLPEFEYLFSKTVFRAFLDSTYGLKDKIGPKAMGQLTVHFNDYMKLNLALADKFISKVDLDDLNDTKLLIRLNAFCVLFHDFCGQVDSKHVRHLLELNMKCNGIMLSGNVVWTPIIFLRKNAATLIKPHEKFLQEPQRLHSYFLNTRLQTLQRDTRSFYYQVSSWIFHVEKVLHITAFELKVEQFKNLSNLLLQGLHYAGQISFLVKALVTAHIFLQTTMTKQTLLAICKLIELLRMIQATYQKNTGRISKVIHFILQYLQYKILHLLGSCKKRITSTKLHDRNVDALAAIKTAEKCMSGPPTVIRILIVKLAIDATNSTYRTLNQEQYEKFNGIMERIELLSTFQLHLQQVCDTSFLYWHQSILSAYFKQIVDRKMDYNSFQHLIHSANDCSKILTILKLDHLDMSKLLKKTNFENVRNGIISHLCAQIEIFLRLEVHANLQLEKMNPFEQNINDYRDLINLCPIEINGQYVILKDHVENYLSAMFYNLTTISLHDWKTYEEMRHLASYRLTLKAVDDYLPNQTLEQGIDILDIMRNIHIFVSKYVYNMNSQIFVEQKSANKHLDCIGIVQIANSILTHGTGILNTTVNFAYQFLRQKFYTFSQFLYDEQIKSRLMKELRSYAERKENEQYPLYPFERADAFNKDIRKLGLSNDGLTYMDLFRQVITHVGNAMGYIRLVRSGSIHANYSASLYLPKFDENLKFAEKCRQMKLHEVTITAAGNVDVNVDNLVKNFSDSTDYFKLLVEAFQPFFRNPHNLHLKNFFLIVPPLILNYVEHMLRLKEKINKKDREEAVLFDDGFAVGIAYILKLLEQISDFNALQWFVAIRERFDAERRKIKEMLTEIQSKNTNIKNSAGTFSRNSDNEKLQQTLILTERRINTHQMEYNLLYYNLSSAKIFFQ